MRLQHSAQTHTHTYAIASLLCFNKPSTFQSVHRTYWMGDLLRSNILLLHWNGTTSHTAQIQNAHLFRSVILISISERTLHNAPIQKIWLTKCWWTHCRKVVRETWHCSVCVDSIRVLSVGSHKLPGWISHWELWFRQNNCKWWVACFATLPLPHFLASSNQTNLRIPQRSRTDVFGSSMKFTRVHLHWISWSWIKRKCIKMRMFCRRYNVAIQQSSHSWTLFECERKTYPNNSRRTIFYNIIFQFIDWPENLLLAVPRWTKKKWFVSWCDESVCDRPFDSTVNFGTYRQTIMSEYIYCEVLMHHFAEHLRCDSIKRRQILTNSFEICSDALCTRTLSASVPYHCSVWHMPQYRIRIASNPHRGKLSSSARSDSKAQWNRLINLCCRCAYCVDVCNVQCAVCTEHSYRSQSLCSVGVGNDSCKKYRTIRHTHTACGHSPVWQHS